jgi:2-isopropylmalate synthase
LEIVRCFEVSSKSDTQFFSQALAVTRVSISPREGGPNDIPSIHSQFGLVKNRKFSGSGSDTDIITASARAYVSSVNKLLSWNARRAERNDEEANGNDADANGNIGDAVAADPELVTVVQP